MLKKENNSKSRFKEICDSFSSLIRENKDLVSEMLDSFPSDMKKKLEDELDKVKQQALEHIKKKE